MVGVVLVVAVTLDLTGLNDKMKRLPVGKRLYMHTVQGTDWLLGDVVEVTDTGYVIRTEDDKVLSVVIDDGTFLPHGKTLKPGDCIRVVGEKISSDELLARGIGTCRVHWENPSVRPGVRGKMHQRLNPNPVFPKMK